MIRSNFHTHTAFCDGKNTPRELAEKAIEIGFDAIGFSGHSFTPFDTEYCMSPKATEQYIAEVNALKGEFAERMTVLCGVEQDLYSDIERERFDYVIGSVHYIRVGGEYLPIDLSAKITADIISSHFSGDFDSYAAAYFETVSEVCERTKCNIIGHIDLIMKYAETLNLSQSDRYLYSAEGAVKTLCAYNVPFEINTGAMSRGVRTAPYPTGELLAIIKSNGGSVMINSDCHDKNHLDYGFDIAASLARQAGYKSVKVLTDIGYNEITL